MDTTAVGGKRKTNTNDDEKASKRRATGGKEPVRRPDGKAVKGLPQPQFVLIEMWGDKPEIKVHPSGHLKPTLINGVIACVIWLCRIGKRKSASNWKKVKSGRKHGIELLLYTLRDALNASGFDESGKLTAEGLKSCSNARKQFYVLDLWDLKQWFAKLSDSDGIDSHCVARFQVHEMPEKDEFVEELDDGECNETEICYADK